jgi:hypothetical protein
MNKPNMLTQELNYILNLCVMLCFINQIYTQGFRQHNFVTYILLHFTVEL